MSDKQILDCVAPGRMSQSLTTNHKHQRWCHKRLSMADTGMNNILVCMQDPNALNEFTAINDAFSG